MSVYDTSFENEEVTMKTYLLIVFKCYVVLKEMNFDLLSTKKKEWVTISSVYQELCLFCL